MDNKLVISSILIILSFVAWYFLAQSLYIKKLKEFNSNKHYVEITQTKTLVKFKALDPQTFVILDNDVFQTGSIKVK